MHFFPSFLGTKKTGEVCWELEGQIYPLDNWSSRNASISCCSSTKRGINQPFFGGKSSFRSIPWSQGFLSGMHSLFVFEKTSKYSQYSWGTSFWASFKVDSSMSPFDWWFLSACIHISWDSLSDINLAKHMSMSDLHLGGQRDNLMSPVVQFMLGLCFLNQSWPRIKGTFPRHVTAHYSFSACFPTPIVNST